MNTLLCFAAQQLAPSETQLSESAMTGGMSSGRLPWRLDARSTSRSPTSCGHKEGCRGALSQSLDAENFINATCVNVHSIGGAGESMYAGEVCPSKVDTHLA